MRGARGYGLGLGLVIGLSLGALSLGANDAAAQTADCGNGELPLNVQCIAADSEGGEGGDATSRSGRGGNGGLALLHETVTTTATSASSQILSDLQTGSIHNEVSFVIEDTDETVVINMGGNPGSTGIHAMNVGGVPQAINTGSTIGSADASGGDSGDATSSGGDGGIGNRGDITGHLGNPVE